METQAQYLASLAYVDRRLDDLQEELGDLPEVVRNLDDKLKSAKAMVDETTDILSEIKKFCSTTKVTLVELKTKEEKLAKQQFMVRNNKEFDAITKEIAHLKEEHQRLSDLMRQEGIKEENLMRILESQKKEYEERKAEMADKKEELDFLASDQNDEVKDLLSKRKAIIGYLNDSFMIEYERIRTFHKDAAVGVKRNSCSGCFSSIPPQKIVEVRNNEDDLFLCESCGRILFPETIKIDSAAIQAIKSKKKK